MRNIDKQAFVTCAAVVKNNKILLLLRNETANPRAHLKWELPGGKIEFGEHPEDTAIRETLEEAGIKIKVDKILPFVQNSYWTMNGEDCKQYVLSTFVLI